ncbi:hypothetical protein ACFT2C_29115, partial [Promicromonospora sp. NPDC057138]|uniref:hypothetical protein n=1 Tax=Promicromonospora sp. NPDC057138 TaxID=3346031 RepID=UPI003636BEA5
MTSASSRLSLRTFTPVGNPLLVVADLALAGAREGGAAEVDARRPPRSKSTAPSAVPVGESGVLAGVALPAGAQLVRAVAEAVVR